MRRVSVRDERTWESSCEYGLFRSPAMAVSVDAVPRPATPRGLHPRQRASFLPRLVEHHPPRRYSPVESRALPRAAAGRYESRRLVRLALGPFRWFRPNPRACTCEIARPPGDRPELSCLTTVSRQSERNFTSQVGRQLFVFEWRNRARRRRAPAPSTPTEPRAAHRTFLYRLKKASSHDPHGQHAREVRCGSVGACTHRSGKSTPCACTSSQMPDCHPALRSPRPFTPRDRSLTRHPDPPTADHHHERQARDHEHGNDEGASRVAPWTRPRGGGRLNLAHFAHPRIATRDPRVTAPRLER